MKALDPELLSSYEAAREVTSHHARTFYFSSVGLPKQKRLHAYAVYAFCRHLDDEVDELEDRTKLPQCLDLLKQFTDAVFEGTLPEEKQLPWVPAFQQTVQECDIASSYFYDLLDGVAMDEAPVRLQEWEDLDRYCYHVASVVGLMMTRVFNLEDRSYEPEALHLGTAMQLTNILRDVREDLEMDRIYLPAQELEEYGFNEALLKEYVSEGKPVGPQAEDWKHFMKFQVNRARDYYKKSERGIAALSNDGCQFTVWMMRDIYAGILEEIEAVDYNVFAGRVRVNFPRKVRLAAGSLIKSYIG